MSHPSFGEGEIVRDDEQDSSLVVRVVKAVETGLDAVKRAVSDEEPRLMLDSHNSTVEVVPAALPEWRRRQLTTLKDQGLRLMQRLWFEAQERRANAANALRVADDRLASLKRLAEQDGLGKEWALLGTPRPSDPPAPELVRVRVLRPFTRQYVRPLSPELRAWLRVCELRDADEMFPPMDYVGIGLNAVTDVPSVMFDELKATGFVERVKPGTPKQLPTGQEIP